MLGTKHTILRSGPASLAQEGFDGPRQASEGAPSRITVEEFGTRFRVDFAEGHKTGFFCDQRDNRKMLASFCKGKTVLDLCCYTGGFAIQAKKLGQASEVTAVDLDEDPIALGKENANLNQVRVKFASERCLCLHARHDDRAGTRKYDVVILDPPKLIRNREEIEEGYRKHFDLNKLAMQLVAPGGVMVTCTCAGLLPLEEFLRLIYQAARQAGPVIAPATAERGPRHAPRICQILAKTGASSDHPIATHCPEGEYLQAVWMRLW
ncbi:MAG: class I SAM-dependent methyltransferase [Pirellulales bacterium]